MKEDITVTLERCIKPGYDATCKFCPYEKVGDCERILKAEALAEIKRLRSQPNYIINSTGDGLTCIKNVGTLTINR